MQGVYNTHQLANDFDRGYVCVYVYVFDYVCIFICVYLCVHETPFLALPGAEDARQIVKKVFSSKVAW